MDDTTLLAVEVVSSREPSSDVCEASTPWLQVAQHLHAQARKAHFFSLVESFSTALSARQSRFREHF